MPNFTARLGLTKPLVTEFYDVSIPNGNMDILDAAPANVTICTSSTRPSSPDAGDVIYETDSFNLLVRQGSSWSAHHGAVRHCTAATRPASGLTFGGYLIYETDTGNRLIRNAANSAWLPLSPYKVASQAERDALGSPYAGFIVWRSDISIHEYQSNAGSWFPLGPTSNLRSPGGSLVTQSGTIATGIAGTETNLAKASLANMSVVAGTWYMILINVSGQFTAGGMSYSVRVREGNATSGTVILDFPIISEVAGFTQHECFFAPWKASATDGDFDLFMTVQRAAGAGTMDVNGISRTSLGLVEMSNTVGWSEVP